MGISPLRGSPRAAFIANDAFNALAMTRQKYHYSCSFRCKTIHQDCFKADIYRLHLYGHGDVAFVAIQLVDRAVSVFILLLYDHFYSGVFLMYILAVVLTAASK
jgi:hypothetical protein